MNPVSSSRASRGAGILLSRRARTAEDPGNRKASRWLQRAAILRVGRNQLYQAVAGGQLGAVRIGHSIRIPKRALLDLLASGNPPRSGGDE